MQISKNKSLKLKIVNNMEKNNKLDNFIIVFLLLMFMDGHNFVNLAFELLLFIYLMREYFINLKIKQNE